MIVFLHSGICSELDENVGYWIEKGVLRLAVPFFFTVSGYLFGTKIVDGKVKEKVKKYCKKFMKNDVHLITDGKFLYEVI